MRYYLLLLEKIDAEIALRFTGSAQPLNPPNTTNEEGLYIWSPCMFHCLNTSFQCYHKTGSKVNVPEHLTTRLRRAAEVEGTVDPRADLGTFGFASWRKCGLSKCG